MKYHIGDQVYVGSPKRNRVATVFNDEGNILVRFNDLRGGWKGKNPITGCIEDGFWWCGREEVKLVASADEMEIDA